MEDGTHKILYVDDQPEAIELVRLALRSVGCEVFGATDGLEAMSLMRELHPDLVLLDLMLPGWDGWQVRDAMQADAELSTMPVVLVTARVPMPNSNVRDLPPADGYIVKPFSLVEIRSTIASLLAQQSGAYRSS
jgi:CheY-like chemotaxis protein